MDSRAQDGGEPGRLAPGVTLDQARTELRSVCATVKKGPPRSVPRAGGLQNSYSLVKPITQLIHDMSVDQPVEHAATLEDMRGEALTPGRLNSLVFGVALAIAVVGVAGVLAFSVSARTREFGIRLALGSQPERLLRGVVAEGAATAVTGILAGARVGFALVRLAGSYFLEDVKMPGALPCGRVGPCALAVVASMPPAARAAATDVIQALRSE